MEVTQDSGKLNKCANSGFDIRHFLFRAGPRYEASLLNNDTPFGTAALTLFQLYYTIIKTACLIPGVWERGYYFPVTTVSYSA